MIESRYKTFEFREGREIFKARENFEHLLL